MSIIMVFTLVFSMYINQAPFNLISIIFGIFSISLLLRNKNKSFKIYKSLKFFFISILTYFSLFVCINYYHFGSGKEFIYAIRRARWCLYALIFVPSIVLIFNDFFNRNIFSPEKKTKILKYFYISLFIVFTFIFIDSIGKLFFEKSYVASLLKSSNTIYAGKRASWTFNPIPFSKLMFFSCALSTFFYLYFKKLNLNTLKHSAIYLLVINFITFILTQTRASWLALLLIFPCIFLFRKFAKVSINKTITLTIIFGIFILFNIKPNFLTQRFKSIYSSSSFSNTYRIEHWKANFELIKDNKLLGVGYASNRKPKTIAPYLKRFTNNKNKLYGHPHSEYIDIASGLGLPAFILFCLILFYPLAKNFYLLLRINGDTKKLFITRILVLCLCLQVFTIFTSFFDKINLITWTIIIINWAIVFFIDYFLKKELEAKYKSAKLEI